MIKRTFTVIIICIVTFIMLNGCQGIPEGAVAVQPFDKENYLGKWYEIARFDYRFEKNLNNVTAIYSLNSDGTIKIDNRGFDYTKNEWKQSAGKAKFAGSTDEAKLKVSFFGPFYAAYNVIALDKDYKYALIAGNDLDYLWLLSREKTMPDAIKEEYIKIARSLGYKTEELIWVEHSK